jgi:subtilisin family serine protease
VAGVSVPESFSAHAVLAPELEGTTAVERPGASAFAERQRDGRESTMARVSVLIEVEAPQPEAFSAFRAAAASETESADQGEKLLEPLAGLRVELVGEAIPVPMFVEPARAEAAVPEALAEFRSPTTNPDMISATVVVPAQVEATTIDELQARPGVRVWPNSELILYADWDPALRDVQGETAEAVGVLDVPSTPSGIDCRPFRPAVDIGTIQALLEVSALWDEGYRGQDVIVGIIDEGVDGTTYPVVGGFARPGSQAPGTAPVTSHGSMCAADVLIAAPEAKIYDYPFLGIPTSGGALAMFQAVLDQRRIDGTPHITSNSYGFVGVPPQAQFPTHEIWDLSHPLHRKVREVIGSGAPTFFAAGNCGENCPSGACQASGIGPGRSIHASNSLTEVLTIAAVNSTHQRIGYSSQGPGMFEPQKPDLAAYSHIFANFGPGRPGGDTEAPFDNGTSAATPVAAGVAALLLSFRPDLTPDLLRAALVQGATNGGASTWDPGFGRGVINAAASYRAIQEGNSGGA